MALLLNIETATKSCSVSLSENAKIIASRTLNNGSYSHAEKLHPFIEEVVQASKIPFSALDAIAVSKGPGSYTGLRIGVSAAKGLCFALDKPLISIGTLDILARTVQVKTGKIAALIDARRMEVYSAVFDKDYNQLESTKAEIIDETSFAVHLKEGYVHFLGDGAPKCKGTIVDKNAIFADNKFPSAIEMAVLSTEKYLKKDFEDITRFEPFYLKDFVAGKSKK